MDELDVTAAESKATYKEIREHVWEHHLTSKSQSVPPGIGTDWGFFQVL